MNKLKKKRIKEDWEDSDRDDEIEDDDITIDEDDDYYTSEAYWYDKQP